MAVGMVLESLINFEKDSIWFMSNYNRLRNDFKGKVVVIKGERVLMDAEDIDKLKVKAEEGKIELSECVVESIPLREMTLII